MADRRVLFFDGNSMAALHWKAGHVQAEGSFLADPVGLEAFEAYLVSHRKSLFYLLADVGDEGFQLESIPYLQGGDRAALIKRRLGQYYYGTSLSAGISLGREKEGRRDERILFAALTRAEAFKPWLESLRKAEVALAGVFSVPLVLAGAPLPFIGQREHCLLITLSAGGLRQTYFEQGQMQFSRLSQLAFRNPDDVAAACSSETAKTYQYLVGQRQVKRGTALSTVIVANTDLADPIRKHCLNSTEIQFEVSDLNTIAARIGLKTTLTASTADLLLAHRLLANLPKQQFAAAEELRLYRLWQTRAGIQGATLAILFGALLIGGRFAMQWHDLTQGTEQLQQQTNTDNQRYQHILDSLPKIALAPEHLRTAIAGFDQLQKRAGGFEQLLVHLSTVLDEMPAIDLQRLEWLLAPGFDTKVGAGKTALPMPAVAAAAQSSAWFVLEIEGRLPAAMASDQRAMIDLLDRFASRLKSNGIDAVLTKRPIDVESAKSFKSGGSGTSTDAAPQFTLRLGKPVAP